MCKTSLQLVFLANLHKNQTGDFYMWKEYCNRVMKAIQQSQQRRADYHILINLSERELKDLGIGRSEIRERVYGETANR